MRIGKDMSRLTRVGACVLAVAACSSKDTTSPRGVGLELVSQGGDGQSGPAGSILAQPLQAAVKNASGDPVRGVAVRFAAISGAGAVVLDSAATSGLDGVARVSARLGPTSGTYQYRAIIVDAPSQNVTFEETATPPPTITALSSSTVQAGDTITITGTHFNTTPEGNAVFFNSARALVAEATETTLRVVVPPCVTPGAAQVAVLLGTVTTNALPVTYNAPVPTVRLAPLEGVTVSGTELGSCLSLIGDSATYLIAPQFATAAEPLQEYPFRMGNTGSLAQLVKPAKFRPPGNRKQMQFDRQLRALEHQLAPQARLTASRVRAEPRPAQALELNSTRSFRVLTNLNSNSFGSVSAALRYIGDNILLYVDVDSPTNGFSDAELQAFGRLFDHDLYTLDEKIFGTESDIDNNGHVIVLLTPAINRLTSASDCESLGFIAGYFFGFDLTSSSSNSNRGEVFYSVVPDPSATESCAHSVESIGRLVPATFLHEFQHMISYNQHVLVRGGDDESVWLNEGLSHIAEEMGSRYYESRYPAPLGRTRPTQLFPDSSQGFINGDLYNSYSYLMASSDNSVTTFSSLGSLEERGAAWLFLRWLGDQKDSTIYGRLVQTSKTSVENVEDKAGETFEGLFGDFSLAVETDSLPGVDRTSIPPRLRFTSRNLRRIYRALYEANIDPGSGIPGSNVPRPWPIELDPLAFNGQADRQMVPGTMYFFRLQTTATSSAISLEFSNPSSGPAFSPLFKAQVSVFRCPTAESCEP